ncbi:MAG: hypothetical protein K2X60_04220 [Xanthobacteraceae bacterium]|nr:hypothetical protein [Xanthobacteraceae bacterium]
MKAIKVALLCVALAVIAAPASAQQPDTAPTGMKAKFKEKRDRFVGRVKNIYFAVGCKILDSESRIDPLVDHETVSLFKTKAADPKIEDLKKEAQQEGLARASKQGECDYFRKNPEAAQEMRKAAADAASKK